jgi:alpha-L-fucosidase
VGAQLQRGDPDGSVWRPGETDVSIRPGWFWHPADNDHVRSVGNLLDLYATSVGRNSKLLLNVPPTRDGLLHEADVAALASFRERRETVYRDLSARAHRNGDRRRPVLELGAPVTFDTAVLGEDIRHGQAVAGYIIEAETDGAWREVTRGTTIGYKKIDRFAPVTAARVRVTVSNALAEPRLSHVSLHLATPT